MAYTHKAGWEGYKVQISETVPEGQASDRKKGRATTGFITEVATTQAITSDYAGHEVVEERQAEHGLSREGQMPYDLGRFVHNPSAIKVDVLEMFLLRVKMLGTSFCHKCFGSFNLLNW